MGSLLSRKSWRKQIGRWLGTVPPKAVGIATTTAGKPAAAPPTGNVHPKLLAARAAAVGIQFLVPEKPLAELLDQAELAEVTMLPRLIRSHKWAMPEHELLALGAIARLLQPRLVVEFGTFRGGSTLAMAANIAADARIVTIDLDPSIRKHHEHGAGVGLSDFDVGCLFRDTQFAGRIEQRFANSVEFMDTDLIAKADLVLVDADHTYEFVSRDTAKALEFLKPGGAIVWHDYTWEPQNCECAGVTRAVNEFWKEHGSCHRIAGTRFVIYQQPVAHTRNRAA
jgi:predicted O-methyltransferase YrrM